MDGFSPRQDPSLNLLKLISTKIFDAEDFEYTTPQDYVENLNKVLSTIDDSWIEHCCSSVHASATTRTECSQRLVLLSSLHTIFEKFSQGNSFLDYVSKEQKSSSPSRPSDLEKQVTDVRTSNLNVSSDEVVMTLDQNCDRFKEIQDKHGKCDDASRWYKETAALLLEENMVIEYMLQLFQSACTFTQHLAKKVIISCVTCSQSKITVILRHIESMFSHDFDSNIKMFDLLKELMSICDLQKKSIVNREIYEWFVNHFESKPLLSLSKVMSSSIKCKRNENSNLISLLSFIKKIIKYGNCNRDKINPFYIPLITDFLINDTSKDTREEASIYQPVILKILKILNLALNLDIVLEKGSIAMPFTDLAVQIVTHFSSLFFSLSKYYLSMNKSFWGTVNSDAISADKNIHSVGNYSMARQLLVLIIKSCLFSSLSESSDDVNIKGCAYQTYDIFKTWFLEEGKSGVNESEWFPVLLGEDDDQWITVLLCLLLIYTYLKSKQESALSSSENMYASQSVVLEQEHPWYRTTDFYTGKSSSPSSHVEQATLSCFYDPLSPHKLFLQFANFIAFDHLVIADFLLSPETYFLAYFTKYISLLTDEWKLFYESCHIKESVPNEKNPHHINVKSMSHPQLNNDNLKSTIENSRSECFSLPVLHESPTYGPSAPSKHLKIQQTFSSTLIGKNDTAIEPPEKMMRPETELPFLNSSDVTITDLESGKRKLTNISSLVSYTDSEDSENEVSDNEEIVVDKSGSENLTPQYNTPLEISKKKDGVMSENKTTKYNVTVPDDRTTSKGCSNLEYLYNSQYNSSNDNESEQDSIEEAEEGCEPKSNLLDRFMTMLIRLQFHIDRLNERNLIPYNVSHLLNLLNLCIAKYECDESESF